jgi:GNAT superfamily N-acetyltransferase
MSLVAEPAIRVGVLVTFLRMDQPPATPAPGLPVGTEVRLDAGCTVERYRELYNTVGAPYVWWLRRTMPDRALAALLRDPRVSIHVLYRGAETCGFYELDRTPWPTVNLSYFGLVPASVGTGLGYPFLRDAVATAWDLGARAVTVNTCTADHPRALPTYIRAGFRPVREVREEWNVPIRLGLEIPDSLRI